MKQWLEKYILALRQAFGQRQAWAQFLEQSRWFRPLLLVCLSVMMGFLLLPEYAGIYGLEYPRAEHVVGAPAEENIKAPRDIEVVDEELTQKRRDEAQDSILKRYDFDSKLGQHLEERVAKAFGVIRAAAPAFEPHRAEFEQLLGISLKNHEFVLLKNLNFSTDSEEFICKLLREVMQNQIIGSRDMLDGDKKQGLMLNYLPVLSHSEQLVENIERIFDITQARSLILQKARQSPEAMSLGQREILAAIAGRLLEPNMFYNRSKTELKQVLAREAIKPEMIVFKKGEMIIRDGERFTARHLLILRELGRKNTPSSRFLSGIGGALLMAVLLMTGARFAAIYGTHRMRLHLRDLLFLAVLTVGGVSAVRLGLTVGHALYDVYPSVPLAAYQLLMPMAAGAMVVRLVLQLEIALLFSLIFSFIIGLLPDTDRTISMYVLVGTVTATTAMRTISARSDLMKAGVSVGLMQALIVGGVHLFQGHSIMVLLSVLPAAMLGGILSGFVALSLTILVEWAFGYSTDLQLLELSNLNHPALKELIVQAPGSYHHSIIVGALVEAAAESVGANPLLARVMAYYHDLGKGCNPSYFVENQRSGQNPHDKLKPSMSAMVIRRHVTDGLELAKKYHLGSPILSGIAEHHGTTLIHYFYHKAKEQAEEGQHIAEEDFRYPGRKPQTREAALVMLGDSIEAASRSIPDPSPARLQGLVNRIISLKFTDGQLEECDLTLRDLHTIAKSFSRVLISIYHHRPEYPDLFKDLGKKDQHKKHGQDPDPKAPRKTEPFDSFGEDNITDHLRRLGL